MFSLLCSLIRLLVRPGLVRELALENLALRQQLTVFKRHRPRLRLGKADRLFWLLVSDVWKDRQRALIIVKPETVVSSEGLPALLDWDLQEEAQRSTRGEPGDSSVDQEDGRS